jgi:hypothetical protein
MTQKTSNHKDASRRVNPKKGRDTRSKPQGRFTQNSSATPSRDIPGTLTAAEAASYLGYKSTRGFTADVKRGVWSGPLPGSTPPRWATAQINAILQPATDRQSVSTDPAQDLDLAFGSVM